MTKNFEINDILNAVKSISAIERNTEKDKEVKRDSTYNGSILPSSNQVKSNKSEILVLDQMIE